MWIFFGLASALLDAGRNLAMKRNLAKQHTHPIIIAWATVFYALPITAGLLLFRPLPEVQSTFWMATGAAVALDVISLFLYTEAVKRADLSLCLPMLAFVPLFLLISSYFINGETPTLVGYFGVSLVMLGAYLLNFDPKASRWYQPLLAIFHNTGTAMMFVVALIWGTTSALHKVAIVASDALFYTGVAGVSIALIFTILAILIDPKALRRSLQPKYAFKLAPIGLMDGLAILAQFIGQGMTLSVFVISLKRTSIIWSAVGGALFFKEKIGRRLFPILLMLAGIVAISFSKV
jgi:drug/metabolite transporter (DMT)-like permease